MISAGGGQMHELMEHSKSKSQMCGSVASIPHKAMGTDFDIGLSEPIKTSCLHHDVRDS